MYGTSVGSLNVKVRYWTGGDLTVDPRAEEFTIWSLSGNQGAGWQYAEVS